MKKLIEAKSDAEFAALVQAVELLAKRPVKRERGGQTYEGIAFVQWSTDSAARCVSFVANEHALQVVGKTIPSTATDVIELAKVVAE